jgi:hypothetical protein
MASMALGLMAAGDGNASESDEHFAAARSQVQGTDDRLDAAVLALAEAEARTALGAEGVSAAVDAAAGLWRDLGLDARGWRTAVALTLDPAHSSGP